MDGRFMRLQALRNRIPTRNQVKNRFQYIRNIVTSSKIVTKRFKESEDWVLDNWKKEKFNLNLTFIWRKQGKSMYSSSSIFL